LVGDRQPYLASTQVWYELREVLATLAAWWEVHASHPVPVLGEPIEIP